MGLGKMFSDPNLFGKLAANPRTSKHLADPSFVQKVCIFPPYFLCIIMTSFIASNDSTKSSPCE
jgi:STI1/HOP-like cochaperone of foldosome